MNQAEISVTADDLLAVIERHARQIATYCAAPPADFNPDNLNRHILRMYSFSEKLNEMWAEAARRQQAQVSNGSEAAAS